MNIFISVSTYTIGYSTHKESPVRICSADDNDDTPMKVQTYKQAIQSLEDVQQIMYSKGHTHEAMQIDTSVDALVSLHNWHPPNRQGSRNFNLGIQ